MLRPVERRQNVFALGANGDERERATYSGWPRKEWDEYGRPSNPDPIGHREINFEKRIIRSGWLPDRRGQQFVRRACTTAAAGVEPTRAKSANSPIIGAGL